MSLHSSQTNAVNVSSPAHPFMGNWYSLGGIFRANLVYTGGSTPVSISVEKGSLDVFAQAGAFDFTVWHRQGTFDRDCGCFDWGSWEALGPPITP